MEWGAKIFDYCERGLDPSAWAEPVSAVSNAAFVVVGTLALSRLIAGTDRPRSLAMACLLAGTVIAIGIGSFLFHTQATRWARLADTMPILVFMLAYLGYALRHFLALSWPLVVAGMGVLFLALRMAGDIDCPWLAAALAEQARARCFNGTLAYLPALIALGGVGAVLRWRRHGAGLLLLSAAGVLAVSMVLRSVDIELCAAVRVAGYPLGTHFAWHLLNAVVLHLLLRALGRH